MPAYESEGFEPPAPVIRARVVGPRGRETDVPLLIDTGADISAVPLSAANSVGAAILPSRAAIQLLSGQQIVLDQAELAVEFLSFRFRGAFLVVDSTHGVIGRNVLNALEVAFDGPRLEWSIAD